MVGRRAIDNPSIKQTYRPTDIQACIAEKVRGRRTETHAAELKAKCEGEQARLERDALELLIRGRWYELEARARRWTLPTTVAGAKRASALSGVEPADMRTVIQTYILRFRLEKELSKKRATRAELAAYYDENEARFITPEQRFVRALVFNDRSRAEAVKAQLEQGRSWKRTAKELKREGARQPFQGVVPIDVAGGEVLQGKAKNLEQGDLSLLPLPNGDWYLFQLAAVLPRHKLTLKEAAPDIRQELTARAEQRNADALNEQLRSKYAPDTACADGYDLPDCGG